MSIDVLAGARGRPEALALVTPSFAWSYAELNAEVDARAALLLEGGTEPGRIVPVVVEPDSAGIVELLALWRVGAVPAPLNPGLTEAERAAARATLAQRDGEHGDSNVPDSSQAILWTSGTAGRPRGVALSFENLEASARAAAQRLALTERDVWLASLSTAHVGGLALVTRSLLLGACLVATGRYRTETVSALLDGHGLPDGAAVQLTHMSLVPTQLGRLLEHRAGRPPGESFRCALIGGAHAPEEIVARALQAGWPLALTYGATEMSSQVATAPPELTRRKPGTVGAPLDGVEVRVGDDGELAVRGPTRCLRYVGGDGQALSDPDGWYHSGDLGRIDADGHVWITGRRSDRIVSGGVTIDAVEVEEVLRSHPAVIDACVVGVPDDEWGQRVAAWVEPVVGEFELDDVEVHVRARLSAPKVPRSWHVAGGIPRNPNGKVDRAKVLQVLAP